MKINICIIFTMFFIINNYGCDGRRDPEKFNESLVLQCIENPRLSENLPIVFPYANIRYIDSDKNNFLLRAIISNNEKATNYFLAYDYFRYTINYHNECGNTALMIASALGQTGIVSSLLNIPGINVNHQNNQGETALMIASALGRTEVVSLLLKRSMININHQNNQGETALMIASLLGQTEIVSSLLKIPLIHINHQGKFAFSALHCAANEGHTEIIESLIHAGADLTLTDQQFGSTPVLLHGIIAPKKLFSFATIQKIKNSRDQQGYNQFHLLATANIEKMAEVSMCTPKKLFLNLLTRLIAYGVDIWDKTLHHHLPIDIAYLKYNQCEINYHTIPSESTFSAFNTQKELFYLFLLLYVAKIEEIRNTPGNSHFTPKSIYAEQLNNETKKACTTEKTVSNSLEEYIKTSTCIWWQK